MAQKLKNKIKYLLKVNIGEFLSKNGLLASLYYTFVSKKFYREHKAVLAGKAKHLKETIHSKENYFQLVRNIHRLEKGLLMRPRKPVYALDYIEETVNSFIQITGRNFDKNNQQFAWFYDVLNEYFNTVGEHEKIDRLRSKFLNVKFEKGSSSEKLGPYNRIVENPVSYEDFLMLAKQRRSVRWFKQKPVPRELIDKALIAANLSPSACNRQPFEIRIIDDPETLQEIVHFPSGTKVWGENIPVFAVLIGTLDAYFSERDRHVIYIDTGLAAMSFMLALETVGLSSCPINWPDIDFREKKMEKLLKLEPFQRPTMCMAIGFHDETGKVAHSEKKPIDKLRKYIN